MFLQQKLLNFTMFQQFSPVNFSVPELAGLMKRFFVFLLAVFYSTK